jgi:hypothetical protein
MTAPFVKGSDTSREAAQSLPEPALARLEAVVFASIVSFGGFGCTDDELERLTELSHQTVSARRRGLVQKGRIVDSGLRRQTRSGRKATVWIPGRGVVKAGVSIDRMARPSSEVLLAAADAIVDERSLFSNPALSEVARWLRHIAR